MCYRDSILSNHLISWIIELLEKVAALLSVLYYWTLQYIFILCAHVCSKFTFNLFLTCSITVKKKWGKQVSKGSDWCFLKIFRNCKSERKKYRKTAICSHTVIKYKLLNFFRTSFRVQFQIKLEKSYWSRVACYCSWLFWAPKYITIFLLNAWYILKLSEHFEAMVFKKFFIIYIELRCLTNIWIH